MKLKKKIVSMLLVVAMLIINCNNTVTVFAKDINKQENFFTTSENISIGETNSFGELLSEEIQLSNETNIIVRELSLGYGHSGAITEDGSLYMWGFNAVGGVGNGSDEAQLTPVKVLDNVVTMSVGELRSGAITEDGSLYMWGSNQYGQVGNGNDEYQLTPVKVLDNVVAVSLGYNHSGAVTEDGSLYMWGANYFGQVGNGSEEAQFTPVKVLDDVVAVSLGNEHSGAVTEDGSLYMWGDNGAGEVGNGSDENQFTPVKVLDNVTTVSLKMYRSGAITEDGSLYMWGFNYFGEVGNGSDENQLIPLKVLDNVVTVSLGYCHSGAITEDGNLYMWGDNYYGEVGNGSDENQFTPVKVLDNVATVSLGYNHSGAVTEDGSLYMWGENYYGEVGNGSDENQLTPVKVLDNVATVSLGDDHSGAIKEDGSLYMWGKNYWGQVGNGSTENQLTPVKIILEPDSEDGKMLDTPVISSINANATGVNVTWGKISGAEKYCVFRKTSTSWEKLGTTSGTTYTDTTAKTGSKYTYTVRCVSADGKTYTSAYDTKGKTISYLSSPQITKLQVNATGVAVTWGKVSGAEKYYVYRKTSTSWKKIGETTGTTYTDTAAKTGSNYTYTVRCVSGDEKSYTSFYDTKGKTISYLSCPQITKMEAKATGVAITWGKVSGAEKYYVYRKTNTSWTKVGETTGTTYTDTTAKTGSNYTYTVRCVSGDEKSYTSHYDTKGKTISYLPIPQITKMEAKATGVAITWGKVSGAEKYYVYRKTSTSWSKVGETTGTTYTDTTVKPGSDYTYTIRCVSGDEKSYTSHYDTKGKTISYMSAPQITKLQTTTTGISITWGKVSGAEKYYVFKKTNTSWTKVGETTGTTYTDESVIAGSSYTYTVRCVTSDGKTYTSYYDTKGASLNLPITWEKVGSVISVIAPKGTSMIVSADETVYVRVADIFENVKVNQEVNVTVTYSDGTNTAKEEFNRTTDENGLVAVTLKADIGFLPKKAIITVIVGNDSLQQTIQYMTIPSEDVAAFAVAQANGKAKVTYNYKSGANPTVTLTFNNPVNVETIRKDLFAITTTVGDKAYNVPISKVDMDSDSNYKVVITLADQYKEGGLTDLTDYDIKIVAKAINGITYNLCDTYGQTYSGGVVTFDIGMID